MNLVKVISSELDSISRRVVKFLRYGKSDVQTSFSAAPYGVDSNPIKDMVAVYAATEEKGKTVIIGYINKNQIAQPGETRFFCTDSAGDEKFYIWLKNSGVVEIGGSTSNIVRYAPLNSAILGMRNDINTELSKIQAAIAGLGGAYARLTVSVDISSSKVDEVKTI